jgi:DNA-directed RNA polymerase subunit M/transcription elongation factor TFIIS
MSNCPKCDSILIQTEPPTLRHIRAVKCLICGYYYEEGSDMNRLHHAAWLKEDNPRQGILKERSFNGIS